MQNEDEFKEHQIKMAKLLRLNNDIVSFLGQVNDWMTRELFYVCALDGMPVKEMINMVKQKYDHTKIKVRRTEFLREKYTDMEPLGEDIKKLKKEVEDVLEESQSVRAVIEQNIEVALKNQTEAQEETIKAKNGQIEMLQRRIEDLERQLKVAAKLQVQPDNRNSEKGKKGILSFLKKSSMNKNAEKFIDDYIKNEKMSNEQKIFLLSCLEEGMSVEDIEKFACPELTIDIMKRIKSLQQETRNGGKEE